VGGVGESNPADRRVYRRTTGWDHTVAAAGPGRPLRPLRRWRRGGCFEFLVGLPADV